MNFFRRFFLKKHDIFNGGISMNEDKAEKLLEFLDEVVKNLKELAEKKKEEEKKSTEK